MAVCKLEIFKTLLTAEKNAKIDKIDEFLDNADYSTKVYSNDTFQYQKITLGKEIKISANQNDFNGQSVGNYIRITQENKKYYYFILSSEWLSTRACRLYCSIDSINTFADKLEWSDKTLITREHADRYNKSFGGFVRLKFQLKYKPNPTTGIMVSETTDEQLINKIITGYNTSYTSLKGNGTLRSFDITYYDANTGKIGFQIAINNPHYDQWGELDEWGELSIGFNCKESLTRNIDFAPEGLNPQLYGEDKGIIYEDNDADSWYLIYNSKTEGEPVDTYLCKDSAFTTLTSAGASNQAIIRPADLENNKYYFIDPFNGTAEFANKPFLDYWIKGDLNPQTITGDNNEEILKTSYKNENVPGYNIVGGKLVCFVFSKSSTFIQCGKMEFIWDDAETGPRTVYTALSNTASITIKSDAVFNIYKSSHAPTTADDMTQYNSYINSPLYIYHTDTKVPTYISDFASLDRSKSTLIKIVKLPYCPLKHTINSKGEYEFELNVEKSDTQSTLGGTYIRIPNNVKFGSSIKTTMENILKPVAENLSIAPDTEEPKNIKYETKLYNSEFYQPKFIYDSFGFLFDLEKIPKEATINDKLVVDFQPSRMFNSALLFTFPEYQTANKDTQDFNNVLMANRNNEMPIYSNAYLDYIRNGYNYDVKVKDANARNAYLNAGLQFGANLITGGIAGALGSRGASKAKRHKLASLYETMARIDPTLNSPGPARDTAEALHEGALTGLRNMLSNPLGAAGANSLVSPLVMSGAIGNAISAGISIVGINQEKEMAEMAIEQKKKLLSEQATSVSTCDSVDLLQEYSKNKAKIKLYKPSETVKEQLFDLFYYNGYARNVRRLPNTTSRYWFNYIQCEPVFKGKSMLVYDNFIEDIKTRYNEGVTVYHNHDGKYDIDQEKENWEIKLL